MKTLFTLGTSNTLIAVDNITEIQNVWETWNPWLRVFPLNNSVIHIYNKPIYLDIAQETSTKIQWRSYDQGTETSKNITSMKLQFYTPPINYTVNGNWSYVDGKTDNEILLYRSIADANYAETYTDLITISNNILVNVSDTSYTKDNAVYTLHSSNIRLLNDSVYKEYKPIEKLRAFQYPTLAGSGGSWYLGIHYHSCQNA